MERQECQSLDQRGILRGNSHDDLVVKFIVLQNIEESARTAGFKAGRADHDAVIKNDGYATGSLYVDHTMDVLNTYNLTQFDK